MSLEEKMNHKIKLIVFDMEGTIFKKVVKMRDAYGKTAPGFWHLIAEHLGEKALAEENATKEKWNRGGYKGYVEWMEDTIRVHQKYHLDKKFFDKVMTLAEYWPGVKETFKALQERGIRTALISGGFKAQADKAAKDLRINHVFAACEYYWDKNGKLVWWNLLPCDYEGKIDFMNLIMKEHGFKPEECAFIGDGKNDIPFAKAVGLSISFNGAKELQEVCTYSINQPEEKEDFKEILRYLK